MGSRGDGSLRGVRVIVAGAGLAGLTAARDLSHQGASVRVIEARQRTGGRVWTYRDEPIAPFHAELGGEFVDKQHKAIRKLCRELDLTLTRVLRRGFGLAIEQRGRIRVLAKQTALWKELTAALEPAAKAFDDAERQWSSTAAAAIGRRSFREVLEAANAPARLLAHATALRGLLLADPEELSALVPVEQAIDDADPSQVAMYRIEGGADRLVKALQDDASFQVDLGHVVRAVDHDERGASVTIDGPNGRRTRVKADYVIAAVPARLLVEWQLTPPLPDAQRRAFADLRDGAATKVLLRFKTKWWRRPGRPRAFGTNMSIGAVWESAEDQQRAPLLTLLAGGNASAQLSDLLKREGVAGVTKRLRWIGGGTKEKALAHVVTWEKDPWARGGYAYFSPRFDPALRDLLARGYGRVLFAGDHTSREYQGYMNGAIESGARAAEDVARLEHIRKLTG